MDQLQSYNLIYSCNIRHLILKHLKELCLFKVTENILNQLASLTCLGMSITVDTARQDKV